MKRDIVFVVKEEGKDEKKYDLTKELYVEDETALTRHMNEIAGQIAYYGQIKATAEDELKRAQDEYDVWLAQEKSKVSGKSETSKEEGVIVANPILYIQKRNKINDLAYGISIAGIICKSFDAKMGMLISMSAQVRSEWQSAGGVTTNRVDKLNEKISEAVPQVG